MRSLRARVALAAGVVLASFVVLTSIALEQAFRDSARSAREDRLLGQLYLLMAAAEAEDGGALSFPEAPPEPRLSLPGSGLYGQVTDDRGQVVWRSASAVWSGRSHATTRARMWRPPGCSATAGACGAWRRRASSP